MEPSPAGTDKPWRTLCRLDEIPNGEARGFRAPAGGFTGLFAVRRGERVLVYVNSCPHVGVPLDPAPNRFLDRKGEMIVCAAHGARFRVEDGECVSGPCFGEVLESVPVELVDGEIRVPEDAGR
ncbi:MAG: (2Fe-2S)-binding protein [Rubritepida sp.]|nr:(2Fe-2S)-binding protein [Rubritepida sp.]